MSAFMPGASVPLAYRNYSFDPIVPQLTNPNTNTVLSLSDGGAHCGVICDASMPTYLLAHWVRDRNGGPSRP
jgi:N-acyl-D-amino-acid deacylase